MYATFTGGITRIWTHAGDPDNNVQTINEIPAGKYRRVILDQSGGATVPTTLSSGQEVLI